LLGKENTFVLTGTRPEIEVGSLISSTTSSRSYGR
jgi:hypothetical protein